MNLDTERDTSTADVADINLSKEEFRQNSFLAPEITIPESEKGVKYHWAWISYIISFYNRPVGIITAPNSQQTMDSAGVGSSAAASGRNGTNILTAEREYPVQFMIRMLQYYLGKQSNLNYAWVTSDVNTTNMQAQWIKGQEVSEFVNFFKGSIMSRIGNAEFTARPMSKDATSAKKTEYDKLMLKYDMQPFFDQMQKMGSAFTPGNGQNFQMPEQIEKWLETNFVEFGAEMAGDIANGIWFTNQWSHKVLQGFMHVACAALCAMEHYVENGRSMQRLRMPYALIIDNRKDDDYGSYDEFIGVIDNMTPMEIFRRWPQFTQEQRSIIEKMCREERLGSQYNVAQNIIWWNYGSVYRDNTISVVTAYFRDIRDLQMEKKTNRNGIQKYKKTPKDSVTEAVMNDVRRVTLVGNRYMVNWGLIDNVVESVNNKAMPMLPIIRFRPNTFLGESISEVARIHRVQDELDFYDFKIREMIGRSKGKTYLIRGSKLGTTTPKEFIEDLASMGIHITDDSGEEGDLDNNRPTVETVDMTLDPGIEALARLYAERRDRMGRILNTSLAAMGQVTKYLGLGSIQNSQNQSNLGVAYLMDGFMEWITMNMRYAVNQQVKLCAYSKETELPMLIGDKGMQYIQLLSKQRLKFEDFFVVLNINDVIDDQRKTRITQIAQAEAQNGRLGLSTYLKFENAHSLTELQELIDYEQKLQDKKAQQAAQAQTQQALEAEHRKYLTEADLIQLREDNANYRQQLLALSKHVSDLLIKQVPEPGASPAQQELVGQNKQLAQPPAPAQQ